MGGPMKGIAGSVRGVLAPHVGIPLAEIAVRTTAISLGKTAEDLDVSDIPALIERTRSIMSGVATSAAIDATLDEIRALGV